MSSSTRAISDQSSGYTPAISDEGSGAVVEAPDVSDLATFFESFADGETIDWAMYQWREYEVEEVLQGSYPKPTLNIGGWEEPAVAGNSYVLFGGVMIVDEHGTLFGTESDFGMGPLPYLVVEDGSEIPSDAAVDLPLDDVPFDSLDGDVMVAAIRQEVRADAQFLRRSAASWRSWGRAVARSARGRTVLGTAPRDRLGSLVPRGPVRRRSGT